MMKNKGYWKIVNYIWNAVWLFVVALLFFGVFQNLGKAEQYLQNVSVYDTKVKMNEQEAEVMYADNIEQLGESFVIWSEYRDVLLSNRNLNRVYEADHISLCGQPGILFPDIELGYFNMEDKTGCIIDKLTSFQLFGSEKALGEKIECNGIEYTVRAIIPKQYGIMITQTNSSKENLLETVTMKKNENDTQESVRRSIELNFGMSGGETGFQIFVDIAYLLLWSSLLFILVQVYFLLRRYRRPYFEGGLQSGIRQIRRTGLKDKEFFKYLKWLFVWLLILGVFVVIFLRNFTVTPDNIPTKWSDFEFWGALFEMKKESIINFLKMPKRFYELEFIMNCMKAFLLNLCSFFLWLMWYIYEVVSFSIKAAGTRLS